VNEKLVDILEKPVQVKVAILFGTMAVVAVGYWYFIHRKAGIELEEFSKQVADIKQQITEKQAIAANLGKFEKEVERLNIELKRALLELPDKREIDQLLDKIADKVKDSGLEISLFKPAGEIVRDFYAEVPVQIEVTGNFHQLATFFDEVAHMSRIVNVQIQDMANPNVTDRGVIVSTSLAATSFRFLDELERPGNAPTTGDSSKKKKKGKK
jgi:type IV pilus assembly protein PilO